MANCLIAARELIPGIPRLISTPARNVVTQEVSMWSKVQE